MAASMRATMSGRARSIPGWMVLAVLIAAASALPVGGLSAQNGDDLGRVTYDRWCAGCHGVDGAGEGDAAGYMLPRPRDFTQALYQIRTTASGELPTDEDILNIIDVGMPGTTMPGWEELLSGDEKDALVQYLKTFSRFFSPDEVPQPLDFGSAPRVNDEVLAEDVAKQAERQRRRWPMTGTFRFVPPI